MQLTLPFKQKGSAEHEVMLCLGLIIHSDLFRLQ